MKKGKSQEHWKKILSDWQRSGQSGKGWCREKTLSYSSFCYWKNRLSCPTKKPLVFEELKEEPSATLVIEWKEASIWIPKNVDVTTLERLLEAIRRVQCSP